MRKHKKEIIPNKNNNFIQGQISWDHFGICIVHQLTAT